MQSNGVKTENRKTMNCAEAERLMIDRVFSGKDHQLNDELDAHTADCAACRSFHQKLSADFNASFPDRKQVPDPDFYDRLLAGKKSGEKRSSRRSHGLAPLVRFAPRLSAAAAAVLLGIWLGGRLFTSFISINTAGGISEETLRSEYMQSYAADLNITDATDLALENYLNFNAGTDDTE